MTKLGEQIITDLLEGRQLPHSMLDYVVSLVPLIIFGIGWWIIK